jgi:mannose-6-phosphate isomerase-like protein (cupin superfamily)
MNELSVTSSASIPSREPAAEPAIVTESRIVAQPHIVDFAQIIPVACPCGQARRAFADIVDFPATIHVTEISTDAALHFHKRLTETYYILECAPDAQMQLDDQFMPVRPGMCILVRPGVKHRAVGRMKVLIVVIPKFDPTDEWDEHGRPILAAEPIPYDTSR